MPDVTPEMMREIDAATGPADVAPIEEVTYGDGK